MHGGDALGRRLDQLALSGRAAKGWHAQLVELTKPQYGREQLSEKFGARNLVAWLRGPDTPGGRAPNAANEAEIAQLYLGRRRTLAAARLTQQLNNDGQGTRIEVHAQEGLYEQSNGALGDQEFVLYDWDRVVDLWANQDLIALHYEWEDIADYYLYSGNYKSGTHPYYEVDHLGFG